MRALRSSSIVRPRQAEDLSGPPSIQWKTMTTCLLCSRLGRRIEGYLRTAYLWITRRQPEDAVMLIHLLRHLLTTADLEVPLRRSELRNLSINADRTTVVTAAHEEQMELVFFAAPGKTLL
mmetsp:Transcript_14505/g.58811  ORF Transcript_14505/g.58811 Transcript_14505/m.58811 type:complete len:121 (+) Transcript_14505:935-1297(+)